MHKVHSKISSKRGNWTRKIKRNTAKASNKKSVNIWRLMYTRSSLLKPISGQEDRASTSETLDTYLFPGRIKPKILKISIYHFPAWCSALKGTVWSLIVCASRQIGRWQLESKTERFVRCLLPKAIMQSTSTVITITKLQFVEKIESFVLFMIRD